QATCKNRCQGVGEHLEARSPQTYGLLASASRKTNIARARDMMAAPIPEIEPPASHATVDPDAITDHRPPCPCCGGRMIIVEIFARGAAPRGPPAGAGISTRSHDYPVP